MISDDVRALGREVDRVVRDLRRSGRGAHAVADQVAVVGRELFDTARENAAVDVDRARHAVAALREVLLRAAR